MSWHITHEIMTEYRDGRLGAVTADSTDAHLIECPDCRTLATRAVDPLRRERIWDEIVDEVDQPAARWLEKGLGRLGVTAHVGRLVALAAVVRSSWLATAAAVLALAAFASHSLGTITFLVVAPLLVVIGVAMSLSPSGAPLEELEVSSPTGRLRLVVVRSSTVIVAVAATAVGPALMLDEIHAAALWLLPAVACTLLTLFLSTVSKPVTAAAVVSVLWVAAVTALEMSASTPLVSFQGPAQMVFSVLVCGLLAAMTLRRDRFDQPARKAAR
ncbi:MAG: zf-HC2 domain-containing protein [Acidimicrobiia bacterium]